MKLKHIGYIITLIFLTSCSVEYTRKTDDHEYLKILQKSFPELGSYSPKIKITNENKVTYSIEEMDQKLLSSIMELEKYGSLRKSAIRMAKNI